MPRIPATVVDPDLLRLARLKRRYRQRDIAARVGVAPQRISDFEQGLRHPSAEQISVLVEALGAEIFASTPERTGEPRLPRNRPPRPSGQEVDPVKSERTK